MAAYQIANNCSEYNAYYPSLGEISTHPSDESRLRSIVSVLNLLDAHEAGIYLENLWSGYLVVSGDNKPIEYEICYPQKLIESLTKHIVQGCKKLGIKSFKQISIKNENSFFMSLINSWEEILYDTEHYKNWIEKINHQKDLIAATKEHDIEK
jgi:hypothetical protein